MKTQIAFSLFVLMLVSTISSTCSAIEISKDGYKVEVYFKEKTDGMHVWGKVNGGRSCKQLNLEIYLRNSDGGGITQVLAAIRNHGGGQSPFKGKDEVYGDADKKKWFINSVYTKCLN